MDKHWIIVASRIKRGMREYDSKEGAQQDAIMLAQKEPGVMFAVYEGVGRAFVPQPAELWRDFK